MDTTHFERTTWIKGGDFVCRNKPPRVAHPWRVALLGAPGVGKGTQAVLLSRQLGACHLSTGEIFRAANSPSPAQRDPALVPALELMRRGELVPDQIVLQIIRERLACLHCGGGFLLDGFPRTLSQAEVLAKLLNQEDLSLSAVINYEMKLEKIVERLAGRLTCKTCGSSFHLTRHAPRVAGICDICGGPLFQREDDRPESVRARMENYQRTAQPLIDFYQQQGLLLSIDADGSPEGICGKSLAAIGFHTGRHYARVE